MGWEADHQTVNDEIVINTHRELYVCMDICKSSWHDLCTALIDKFMEPTQHFSPGGANGSHIFSVVIDGPLTEEKIKEISRWCMVESMKYAPETFTADCPQCKVPMKNWLLAYSRRASQYPNINNITNDTLFLDIPYCCPNCNEDHDMVLEYKIEPPEGAKMNVELIWD